MNKILINKENGKPLAAVLRKEEGYSRILSRSGFTGTTFTCLIIFSCTSRISISYCSMRTRVPATGISSSASRITPLTVRASSSGRCQLNALLISRTLAVPSIMTEPSFCGVTYSASVGDIDVVKSPTISSRISSTVTSPWISPYSLTTSPTFFLLR